MAIKVTEIIAATTSGSFSGAFNVVGMATITCSALGNDEGVQLQYSNDGTDFQTLYLNGVLQEITNKHSILVINGPGKFRCQKSATVNPVSVNLWESGSTV